MRVLPAPLEGPSTCSQKACWAAVTRRANIPPSRGRRLVEQGLVKPDLVSGANWFFQAETAERIVNDIRKATEMR